MQRGLPVGVRTCPQCEHVALFLRPTLDASGGGEGSGGVGVSPVARARLATSTPSKWSPRRTPGPAPRSSGPDERCQDSSPAI